MVRAQGLFWELLLLHLGLRNILGEESCEIQLYIKRHSVFCVSAGKVFKIECPVKYCGHRPNVTWCKVSGQNCLPLGDRLHLHTSWEERQTVPVFILHFEPIRTIDNGSYSCSANFHSRVIKSHSIAIHVTEQTQNNSDYHLITLPNIPVTTNASGPPSVKETVGRPWLLYSLLPLGALPLLLLACFCLICFLKSHQEKEIKPPDSVGREINLVDTPVSSRKNPQELPSETGVYDNDPWFRIQEESEVYSNSQLEGNKQGIVYASLNHSVIGRNPRQARNVQEAPTEYASVRVRS
ncbi:B- and T-lymphocyte attenuator [Nannospalax galili]|nr:B- and T-lymphocyte attenuator [Nannospalax galili]